MRIPDDTARRVKDFLAGRLTESVGLALPSGWSPKSPPHVVVFDDGGPSEWPILTEPRIRVTVWAAGRTASRDLAALCIGLLMTYDVPDVAHVRDPSSIIEARDDNGGIMASFTVAAKSRTIVAP